MQTINISITVKDTEARTFKLKGCEIKYEDREASIKIDGKPVNKRKFKIEFKKDIQ